MTSDSNCLTSIAYAPMSLWRLTVAIHKMFLPVPAPPPPQTLSGRAIDFLELRSEVKITAYGDGLERNFGAVQTPLKPGYICPK